MQNGLSTRDVSVFNPKNLKKIDKKKERKTGRKRPRKGQGIVKGDYDNIYGALGNCKNWIKSIRGGNGLTFRQYFLFFL